MKTTTKYFPEVRERAVRVVLEHQDDHESEQALYARRPFDQGRLIHHRDRGVQYVAIRYTQRLAEAGVEPSVGSVGDSSDHALAETINGLYKAEANYHQPLIESVRGSFKEKPRAYPHPGPLPKGRGDA